MPVSYANTLRHSGHIFLAGRSEGTSRQKEKILDGKEPFKGADMEFWSAACDMRIFVATPDNDGKEADMNLKFPILDSGEAKKVASPLL